MSYSLLLNSYKSIRIELVSLNQENIIKRIIISRIKIGDFLDKNSNLYFLLNINSKKKINYKEINQCQYMTNTAYTRTSFRELIFSA